jgi:N-acetyl-anhydromuramyl-L-alanine amidase AmpD
MPAQIRPTRIDVTDRFPMVGFKILADRDTQQVEVAIGDDPDLFSAEGKKNRSTNNFYSTRGNNGLRLSGGEGGIIIPPEILARFVGKDKIYFGLATAAKNGPLKVDVMPSSSSPYINIKGLSNRSMSRVRVLPSRQQRAAGYSTQNQAQLDWAGDAAQPGMTKTSPGNGKDGEANIAVTPKAVPYDDGFGPMPDEVAKPSVDNTPKAQARSLDAPAPEYPEASRFVPTLAQSKGRGGKDIAGIIIHITDAPTTSSTVNTFKSAPKSGASAHYLVGQDGEIVQFVLEEDTANHAHGVNSTTIGIEHVAVKKAGATYGKTHYNFLPVSDAQYCASAALVTYLCDKYGLTPDRETIKGHNEVDKGRDHDPIDCWNWDHFMDLVEHRYCKEQPVVSSEQGYAARKSNGKGSPTARALVIDKDDIDKAKKYAGSYRDLFTWWPAAALVKEIEGRGFTIQKMSEAVGDLNLDFYKIKITTFPSGWDAPKLLNSFIRNINNFINTSNTEFIPYEDVDEKRLTSTNPLGTVFYLDIAGPDNAAVVISDVKPQFYAVTTINTPRSGDHPVSGHRQFGYIVEQGVTTFYTRGADRATLGFPGTETAIFTGGEWLWQSFQEKLAEFINDNGGTAEIIEPFSERFNPSAIKILFGEFETAQGLGLSRTMSSPAFTVNWDDVELIAQPTNFTCWAAAGAMLVGWRDSLSLSPETVAQICKRSTASGLSTDDNSKFASEMGFVAVPPVCYTEEGFRNLLENNGPLWVSEGTPPNLHAIVVTGMYSDGTNTYIRIADPWDRAVGTPGKPGTYANTHATGSRYIMRWEDFVQVYEAAMTGEPPNQQILHTGNPNAITANTGQTTPPLGYAQSQALRRPLGRSLGDGQSFTINWDEVQQIAQPTDVSCWATSASMVLGWRDKMSLTVEGIAQRAGMTTATGLDPAQVGQFAKDMGMTAEPPQSYTVEAFRQMITKNGPLWVGASVPGLHAIVVTGLYSDDTETYVRITDPWDRDIGTPGAQGKYLDTHATGSRYIMRWADFVAEYEAAATNFAAVNLQILHCGGTFDQTPNTGGSAPAGYAMAYSKPDDKDGDDDNVELRRRFLPPPLPRARALSDIGGPNYIGGSVIEVLRGNRGNITWALDQFHGAKHPGNVPPQGSQTFKDSPTIKLDQWPVLRDETSNVSAFFAIDWMHNGRSVSDVRIRGTNVANGLMPLDVRAQIIDDSALYQPNDCAALKIKLTYNFQLEGKTEQVAATTVTIYGDGTHEIASEWQANTLAKT